MVTIIFEPHATTSDNEVGLASGWNDVALSETGRQQAKELGKRRKLSDFGAIFTSDLERAYQTARLAFPDTEPKQLRMDWRLRECDYGRLTQHPKTEVDAEKPKRISTPFPEGESYEQATRTHALLSARSAALSRRPDGADYRPPRHTILPGASDKRYTPRTNHPRFLEMAARLDI